MASNFVAPYNSPAQNPQSAVQKTLQPMPSVSAPSGFSSGNMLPTRPTAAALPTTVAKPALPPGLTSGASAILRSRASTQQPIGIAAPQAPPQAPLATTEQGGARMYPQVVPQASGIQNAPAVRQPLSASSGHIQQQVRPAVMTPGAEAIMRSRRSGDRFQTPPHRLPPDQGVM